jgi:tRNA pseudouridine38-40 synthase
LKRYLIAISYDGKKFHGFQQQKELKTVEGTLKETLRDYLAKDYGWQALSRTDKGVSAKINFIVANFEKEPNIDELNKKLEKEGIKILFIERVPINLPIRGLAKYKVYKYYLPKNLDTYYVFNGEKNLKVGKEILEKIDWKKVKELKELFKGKKYVINFSKWDKTKKHSYITNFHEIDIKDNEDFIEFTIKGDKFFWEEVRRLINIFISYLTGYLSKEKIVEMMKEKKEQKPKAYPAEYLVLEEVKLDL